MTDEDKIDPEEIIAIIWWAQMRSTLSESGWGGCWGVEAATDEEMPILKNGLAAIMDLFEQIDSHLVKMQDACPLLAEDRDFVIDDLYIAQIDKEQYWDAHERIFNLSSQGTLIADQLEKFNDHEEQGNLCVEDSLPNLTLSELMGWLVNTDLEYYKENQGYGCFKFHEFVFRNSGFLLAAQFGDEAIRIYLACLAKELFCNCNIDKFIEALLAMYKRRQKHSQIDDE
ncbi:hypothetical protein Enr10x_00880 [Gimesia panareensis]|uniref:Uncharacterized protein n=1 Tax=Gimesia panareensis TaxID=2527978 RepID=A0A517PZM7_9PLAN|nr:hypothetical protein [Gimesia panareensis]QDT24796.1 hypothetical protein Enr10x_00880 [Gimesia panareensis]